MLSLITRKVFETRLFKKCKETADTRVFFFWWKENCRQVKLSLYRPGQVLGVWEVEASILSRQLALQCGKFLSSKHLPPLPWYSFLLEADSPSSHGTAGRFKSMKNSSDTIGNRNLDLPACCAVPQPTAPSHEIRASRNKLKSEELWSVYHLQNTCNL